MTSFMLLVSSLKPEPNQAENRDLLNPARPAHAEKT